MDQQERADPLRDLDRYLRLVFGNMLVGVQYELKNNVFPIFTVGGMMHEQASSPSCTMMVRLTAPEIHLVHGADMRRKLDSITTQSCFLTSINSSYDAMNISTQYVAVYQMVDVYRYIDELEKRSWEIWNAGMDKLIGEVLDDPDKE